MAIKKTLGLTFLLLILGVFLTGCSSGNEDSDIKVETDETANTGSGNTDVSDATSQVEESVDEELITNDEVELGELI